MPGGAFHAPASAIFSVAAMDILSGGEHAFSPPVRPVCGAVPDVFLTESLTAWSLGVARLGPGGLRV